jgi:phosphate/sulfate permease
MLGWFQALMPREDRFFDLFVRHATIVVAGAEALRGLLQDGERAERWNIASSIVVAWVITIPAAGLIGALFYASCGLIP